MAGLVSERLKRHYWGLAIGSLGFLIVTGYLAFEYLFYQEILEDIAERPLEHIIIFSLFPLSFLLGFLVDKKTVAERQMLETRIESDTIINNIDEGVLELDRDYKILSVNEFLLKLLKMKKEDVIGKNCYEVFHEFQEICLDCPAKVTFETGAPAFATHTGKTKDGSKTFVEMNTYPLTNSEGRVVKVIKTVTDISERKRHEEEMVEKRYLEKITKSAIDRELKMVELKKKIKDLEKRIKTLEGSKN
jgi:PAS domain S-box-containing protein